MKVIQDIFQRTREGEIMGIDELIEAHSEFERQESIQKYGVYAPDTAAWKVAVEGFKSVLKRQPSDDELMLIEIGFYIGWTARR